MKDPKLLFLFSQSPRSGHNFVADVLRKLVATETVVGDRSEVPFGPIIDTYHTTLKTSYKSNKSEEFLNSIFIEPIRIKLLDDGINKVIKYTSFVGAETTLKYFPDDISIVSFRDPKDCLFSLFKGIRLKNDFKSKIKKILWPTGIYHYQYARKYSSSILKNLPKSNDFIFIRYELLVRRDKEHLEYLIKKFNSRLTYSEFSQAIDSINVINTSFFKEETGGKNIWQSTKVTEAFNPVNRNHSVNKLQLIAIKKGSKSLRKAMGYLNEN